MRPQFRQPFPRPLVAVTQAIAQNRTCDHTLLTVSQNQARGAQCILRAMTTILVTVAYLLGFRFISDALIFEKIIAAQNV